MPDKSDDVAAWTKKQAVRNCIWCSKVIGGTKSNVDEKLIKHWIDVHGSKPIRLGSKKVPKPMPESMFNLKQYEQTKDQGTQEWVARQLRGKKE